MFKRYGIFGLAAVGVIAIGLWVLAFFGGNPSPIPLMNSIGKTASYRGGVGESAMPSYGGVAMDVGAPSYAPSANVRTSDRKVVRNGSLDLLVKDADQTAQTIQGVAVEFNGFVQDARVYEIAAGIKSGTVSIRVPSARFTEAMDRIKTLAVKVESEHVSAADVTEQYVDLEAQLTNAQAEEAQYLQIMKTARTVEDTLNVASRLAQVRERIERLQGQLKYLSSQVDMSVITTSLTAEADIEVFGIRWRPLVVAKQAVRDLIEGITVYIDGLIRFIIQIPIYLLWIATLVLVAIGGWRLIRWIRDRFFR